MTENNLINQLKFKNKYRIESARLKGYNYSSAGAYFITICTKNKECFFGDVVNKKMEYSKIGEMANRFWLEIKNLHNFIVLDEWIVMPNHVHGILFIKNDDSNSTHPVVETYHWHVSTFGKMTKRSISIIINHYKGILKKWCNKNGHGNFNWQPRFHDRIIRDELELNNERQYILNNPANWEKDRNNKENLYM